MKVLKNTKGEWDWFKISLPIFCALVGLIYNNVVGAIDKKADTDVTTNHIERIDKALSEKANNEVILEMLKNQRLEQEMIQENLKEQKIVDKETLKILQLLNVNVKLLEQRLK